MNLILAAIVIVSELLILEIRICKITDSFEYEIWKHNRKCRWSKLKRRQR